MNVISLLILLVLVLAAIGVYSWRTTSRTARRAENKSATAVEAAKLAIVTATTHQQPADLEQGRIRTPPPKHASARWSATPPERARWA